MMTTYRESDLYEDPCIFPDCGHILAVSSMDGIMDMSKHYAMHDHHGQMHPTSLVASSAPFDMAEVKVCPQCRGSLRNVARYGRIVRRALLDEATKKFIAWANQQHQVLAMQLMEEKERLEETSVPRRNAENNARKAVLSRGRASGIKRLVRAADPDRYTKLIKLRDAIQGYAKRVNMGEQPFQRVADLVRFAHRRRQSVHGEQTSESGFVFVFDESVIQVRCHMLATLLLLRCDILALQDVHGLLRKTTQSQEAVSSAMEKMAKSDGTTELLADCAAAIELAKAAKCIRQEIEGHMYLAQLCHYFRHLATFDPESRDESRTKLQRLGLGHVKEAQLLMAANPSAKLLEPELLAAERALLDAPFYENVTTAEIKAVYQAMSREFSGTGHWYTCEQGHYFTVGECGMPMEQAECPECGSAVGGLDHANAAGVRRADDVEELGRGLNRVRLA